MSQIAAGDGKPVVSRSFGLLGGDVNDDAAVRVELEPRVEPDRVNRVNPSGSMVATGWLRAHAATLRRSADG